MQHFLCPQCGAAVASQAPGAVMVVCPACRSTLTRDAETARQVGRLSAVVDDGSAVRIGTRGALSGHGFEVVGRLRLQYEEGGWNEWYVLFDAGGTGWLSDASGQYALTRRGATESPLPLPAYDELKVGHRLKVDGVLYTVADVRRSRCVGGEGELPEHPGDGWDVAAADLRGGVHFATLDYSDGAPVLYAGEAGQRLTLDEQTMRSSEEILAAIGRVRGQILSLACPNCGAPVSIVAAMATQVICSACSSRLDCSGEQVEVIEAHKRAARFRGTLPLGASGNLAGGKFTIIGVMRCEVPGDSSEPPWTEYLMLDARKGYRWLVETQTGWQLVTVCDEWPVFDGRDEDSCRLNGGTWNRTYHYGAQVTEVFGAFNWRVRLGDRTRVTDFAHGQQVLSREQGGSEITWSLASPIGASSVHQAFGVPTPKERLPPVMRADGRDEETEKFAQVGTFASLVLMMLAGELSLPALLTGLVLVWLPPALTWLGVFTNGEASR
ncbi:hypothetical protein ARC20_00600 [Stenotrophomonas panacihumi]|uniref:DUF4178 domain-containing protein n=1 Tax=Stenotrophomonas panacihumi TaxID=676599 RepID=A0A0R0AE23_9GAMM|nr:DUF4178 domain-containing protein [Stenotrophomonas panacihumi]KRG43243.1 hypothetical protein ARC20_00600 [Stenotrophomonas panacihumi]PTN55705.1 DUF4178 domain-containing protein [Stenotrophomonas panacihumi]